MQKYLLEFVLHTQNSSLKTIKSSLAEFGEDLQIIDFLPDNQDVNVKGKNFKININTEEPTTIFDICSQFGRIRTIKVNEIKSGGG
jgi:dihydroxyacetone kinase-like predicted kinase